MPIFHQSSEIPALVRKTNEHWREWKQPERKIQEPSWARRCRGSPITVPRRAVWEQTEAESSGHFLALVTLQLTVNRSNRTSSCVRFPGWSHYSVNVKEWMDRLPWKSHPRVLQRWTWVLGKSVQTKLLTEISSARDLGQKCKLIRQSARQGANTLETPTRPLSHFEWFFYLQGFW